MSDDLALQVAICDLCRALDAQPARLYGMDWRPLERFLGKRVGFCTRTVPWWRLGHYSGTHCVVSLVRDASS